ncbi:MAG: KamA family radical SAM protein [Candidatus Roizmanbacteria bacterium]|nr:MAG: KamA family radical SAM protein [Candidatus Roizmanbacteria bacterium]
MRKKDFIFSLNELKKYLKSKKIGLKKINLPTVNFKQNFPLLIPKHYLQLVDWDNPEDPLKKMAVPNEKELAAKEYELEDPLGEKMHTPIPGIVHHYNNRCLLNLTTNCSLHCRFCFRKHLLKEGKYIENSDCIKYIKEHEKIWEVILSGGDPFMLDNYTLSEVLINLRQIKHIKMIRFHTRTPVVYPQRMTPALIKLLNNALPYSIVFHINHPREISKEFIKIVSKLRKKTSLLLSQTVLMKDINNDPKILEELFKKLAEIGIKPYYLHHPDLVRGTHHFRVSIEDGKRIMKKLQENLSGICLPEYVVYLPKGGGKLPVSYLKKIRNNHYASTNSDGKKLIYVDY